MTNRYCFSENGTPTGYLPKQLGVLTDVEEAEDYINSILAMAFNISSRDVVWPVTGKITSYFGETGPSHPSPHMGIDIAVPEGTEVHSASAGIVFYTGYNDTYGNHIRIRDTNHEYLYGHLSEISVEVSGTVKPGQVIGLSGNTGKSTGPHLHFGVKDLIEDHYIDPMLLLAR